MEASEIALIAQEESPPAWQGIVAIVVLVGGIIFAFSNKGSGKIP